MNCYECQFLVQKKSKQKIFGIPIKEPVCSKGVTNNRNDPQRKNGICQSFVPNSTGEKP